jgi:hypothetical protein
VVMAAVMNGVIQAFVPLRTSTRAIPAMGPSISALTGRNSRYVYSSIISSGRSRHLASAADEEKEVSNSPSDWDDTKVASVATSRKLEGAEPRDTGGRSAVACSDCDLCDGSGRIAGGLGAVLPWLPVKAYRPCPNFVSRGGTYQRSGQGLDEIAFGRDSTYQK